MHGWVGNAEDDWSGRRDLNPRPPAPKAGALPGCATPRADKGRRRGGRRRQDPRMALPLLASATAMADVQPLRALHYDPAVVGGLANVVAPPYDVIDSRERSELIARSPFNVVAVDLPEGKPDPYTAAGELFESWQLPGVLGRGGGPAGGGDTPGST